MNDAKPMRVAFGETLCQLAQEFDKVVVLDADVSSSTQTKLFGQQCPERFYNFGIAEGNMLAAAAGMASCGLIPVASTFAFLMTMRAADPIRSLIAYGNLNVKLVGGYAGLSDFADGASHQAVIDMAIMNAMPNMTVLVPSDLETTAGAVRAMLKHQGPVYLRLIRESVGSCHQGDQTFQIGKAHVLRDGADITLAVCGSLLAETLKAADTLEKQGTHAAVVEFGTLKPLDTETLASYAKKTKAVVTIEEHNIQGGFGSAVASYLSEHCPTPLRRVGIADTFCESGKYTELLDKYGLTSKHIVTAAQSLLT